MYSDDNNELSLTLIMTDFLSLMTSYFLGTIIWNILIQGRDFAALNVSGRFSFGMLVFTASYVLEEMVAYMPCGEKFLKKGIIDMLFYTVGVNIGLLLVVSLLLYVLRGGESLSRGVVGFTIIVNIFVQMLADLAVQRYYLKKLNSKKISQMLVITSSERLDYVLGRLTTHKDWQRRVSGLCILDDERQGEVIKGIKVVANFYDVIEYIKDSIVDEVLLYVSYTDGKHVKDFIGKIQEMGIVVYLNLNVLDGNENIGNSFTRINGIPVMTFSLRSFAWNQLLLKRTIDIIGSLVGLVITAIMTPFVAVPLLLESPGPLFFRQKRVGRNGRYFEIIKFRSMYMDAEERKKELMAQNEMSGAMFKMTNDPRVTKVGKFIRATSIDEFPQFWNVLKGDMSLVGTRPPTVDEFKQYTPYHKRRLSLKPGITGLWQVSGRSNIEDFEEVVRLDLEYIDNWSVPLDIKILLKTVFVVFAKVGSK